MPKAIASSHETTRFEQFVVFWLDKGLSIYLAIRRPFLNRIALLGVAGGLLIASGSWWVEPAVAAVAPLIDPSYELVHAFLRLIQNKAQDVDAVSVICGTVIVCVSLAYHFLAFYADRVDARYALSIDLARADDRRKNDEAVIARLNQRFPHAGLEESIVGMLSSEARARNEAIIDLNARLAFWRDGTNSFRTTELEELRIRLTTLHAELVTKFARRQSHTELQAIAKQLADLYGGMNAELERSYIEETDGLKKRRGFR